MYIVTFLKAAHEKVTKQEVETSLTDGAYNSALNVEFAEKKNIKWYLTAIQGFKGNFSFEKVDGEDCYNVTDLTTVKIYKSTGPSKKGAYNITLENGKSRYFKIEQIINSFRRAEIKNTLITYKVFGQIQNQPFIRYFAS